MTKWILGTLDRLFVLLGAVLLSQAPLYVQHYTTQLAGHAEELQFQVHQLEASAVLAGKPLSTYIQKFVNSNDEDFARQGQLMKDMIDRSFSFKMALENLQTASILKRPFIFIAHFNFDVAKASWATFEYGLAFSLEGLAYALAGGLLGYIIFILLAHFFAFLRSLFSSKKTAPLS